MSKVITHEGENFGNSQEQLQKFVQEQKSENTVKKKMSSDMKCFTVFRGEITGKCSDFGVTSERT